MRPTPPRRRSRHARPPGVPHRRHATAGHRDSHAQARPRLRHGGRGRARAARREPADPQERVRGRDGPLGIGEVDAHEPRRLPRHPQRGRVLAQRPESERPVRRRAGAHPQQGDRLRLPGRRPAAARLLAAQRGAAADLRGHAGAGTPPAGVAGARARGAQRPHGAQTERAVGGAAAAGGDRPGARERAEHPARRRAHRQPRLGDGRGDHAAVRGAARPGPDDPPGHPRARHRGARPPPDPPARRQDRARREDGTLTVKRLLLALALAGAFAACKKAEPAPLYEKIAVQRRDIVVSASAAGSIQPILTVDVKSKASGQIIEMRVETGDEVRPGQLLAKIDPRIPQANLEQAQAALEVANAQLANAKAQLARSDTLFKAQAITETDYESAKLAYAQANAQVVNARTNLQTAKDAMDDTQVRAPLKGTIIQKNVELGTVISSPTKDVGGGTVLLRMANLDTVQVSALVDETDVGKVQPGVPVTIT